MSAEPRLHLIMTSSAARDCLGQLQPGDTVLLLDRGVELMCDADLLPLLHERPVQVCASEEDAAARGISFAESVIATSDKQFVALSAGHAQVLSWI